MEEPERVCSRCGARYSGAVIFCPSDGAPLGGRRELLADDRLVGLELADQFRLEQLIGIGAMGRVYRAHQKGIERPVAVKILHRELLKNPQITARFLREAKVASRLEHPNVVQLLFSSEIPEIDADLGGEAYLVMEYLDGISLRSALAASDGAMPLPRSLHIVLQICDAVGEAHARGIVHRDLKPENVMLVRRGDDPDFVKVLDFGIARLDSGDGSIATGKGVILGSAWYISPEGAQGRKVGAVSDVYSIAVLLFQCLAGQTPFDGDSPIAVLLEHAKRPAPDVRTVARASYVPEPIARVIAQNLAKEPERRATDARELGRALLDAARASGLSLDDLVMRSTLLGGARSTLQLASLQRTKSLPLTPELESRLTPGRAEEPDRAPVEDVAPPPSGPGSEWMPPGTEPMSAARRRWVVAACLALGAGLVLLVARALGIFAGAP